jgi:hypothetical protein
MFLRNVGFYERHTASHVRRRHSSVYSHIAIFWEVAPYNPYANWRFGGRFRLHLQDRISAKKETSVLEMTRQNSVGSRADYMAL